LYDTVKEHYIMPWEPPKGSHEYNDVDIMYADEKWYWNDGDLIDLNRYRMEISYE